MIADGAVTHVLAAPEEAGQQRTIGLEVAGDEERICPGGAAPVEEPTAFGVVIILLAPDVRVRAGTRRFDECLFPDAGAFGTGGNAGFPAGAGLLWGARSGTGAGEPGTPGTLSGTEGVLPGLGRGLSGLSGLPLGLFGMLALSLGSEATEIIELLAAPVLVSCTVDCRRAGEISESAEADASAGTPVMGAAVLVDGPAA